MKTVFAKYILVALLVVFSPIFVSAQKNNLFVDAGLPTGFSVTYNYRVFKRLGIGIGFQDYHFKPTASNRNEFVPAVFGDIRFNSRQRKKHFFFYFLDLGINFYKANDDHSYFNALFDYVTQDNGFYTGFGFGYFRMVTKHGGGWYVSFKPILNGYRYNEYLTAYQDYRGGNQAWGTPTLSAGFKF